MSPKFSPLLLIAFVSTASADNGAATASLGSPTPVMVTQTISLGPDTDENQAAKAKADYVQKVANIASFGAIVGQKVEQLVVLKHIEKRAEDDLADLIVNKFKGCQALDEECKNLIIKMNRALDASTIDAALAKGTARGITIPVSAWTATTTIDVGNKHRVAQESNVTTQFYSKSLAKALGIAPDSFFPRGQGSFFWLGDSRFRLQNVIEDDPRQ